MGLLCFCNCMQIGQGKEGGGERKPVPYLHLYRGIKGCLREPAGRLESHDKGPVGMGCQACQLPTPNEHLAKAGRTHSSSTLPACDRETSRQLDRRRMWQLARRKALA